MSIGDRIAIIFGGRENLFRIIKFGFVIIRKGGRDENGIGIVL
jgi:hypothetical protein